MAVIGFIAVCLLIAYLTVVLLYALQASFVYDELHWLWPILAIAILGLVYFTYTHSPFILIMKY